MRLIILLLLLMPAAFASDGCIEDNNCQLFAEIYENDEFYDAQSANISIYYPNSTIFINNSQMTKFDIGRFYYNYTPNVTGNWYGYVDYYNSTNNKVATAGLTWEVKEESFMAAGGVITFNSLSLIIGLLVYLAVIFYIVFYLLDKEHIILKVLTMMYSIFILYLIPKSIIDATVGSNGSTANIFFGAVNWYIIIVVSYVMIWGIYKLLGGYPYVVSIIDRLKR